MKPFQIPDLSKWEKRRLAHRKRKIDDNDYEKWLAEQQNEARIIEKNL